ncbi:hypothetical protein HK097_007557 [Rhizophlyctis rosea]|uniref:FAD-binding PCMH-type domain-containing protein n=1 Tax=Rhizophlyctis rosea TaxID=64517 RepID=A0AAD5SJE6_9FUNG|nr:hypothetical protein HK097_007557 [Rhizophlyctis rosea]
MKVSTSLFLSLSCLVAPNLAAPAFKSRKQTLASCLAGYEDNIIWKDYSNGNYTLNQNGQRTLRQYRAPAAIFYAQKPEDVVKGVKCARKAGVLPVPRSGGHSYESLSSLNDSLVIDLSTMSHFKIAKDQRTFTVSPGIRLGNMYTSLYRANPTFTFAAGTCPSVGLGGLISAGGYGMLSRRYGLSADNVISAKVVLASGKLVTSSPRKNPDLFFAIRGGGGGSYGIVVQYTLPIIRHKYYYLAELWYPNVQDLPKVFNRLYQWRQKGLDRHHNTNPSYDGYDVDMQFNIYSIGDTVKLAIQYHPEHQSSPEHLRKILKSAGLVDTTEFEWKFGQHNNTFQTSVLGSHMFFASSVTVPKNETEMYQYLEVPQLYTNDAYKQTRKGRSEYLRGELDVNGLANVWIKSVERARKDKQNIFIQSAPYGAKMREIADDSAGYPHRAGVSFSMQTGIYFKHTDTPSSITLAEAWLLDLYNNWRPFTSGEHYQGYVFLEADPRDFYVGNWKRLVKAKKRYDPEGVFWTDLVPPKKDGKTVWFGEGYPHE